MEVEARLSAGLSHGDKHDAMVCVAVWRADGHLSLVGAVTDPLTCATGFLQTPPLTESATSEDGSPAQLELNSSDLQSERLSSAVRAADAQPSLDPAGPGALGVPGLVAKAFSNDDLMRDLRVGSLVWASQRGFPVWSQG